jgi:zeaxanthin glucosyltransferase
MGFVSLPYAGHINPMIALARTMQSRGHEVTFIGFPDVGPAARAAGLKFFSYGEKEFPEGSAAKNLAPLAKLHGLDVLRGIQPHSEANFKFASQHLPRALAETGVDALVLDMSHRFLELVPLSLGMPYAQVWNIFPIDMSGATPPCFFSAPYDGGAEARPRNLEITKLVAPTMGALPKLAAQYAESIGLAIDCAKPGATLSRLAIVSQSPKEFDFPTNPWPAQFHYAGPFFDETARVAIPFPWDKLDGRPLIYASLGSLLNGIGSIFQTILAAIGKLSDLQAVLSTGSNVRIADLGPIPSNVIAVEKAPQIELLKRAALCITHAGLNTALESLAHGVPMVAIPIGFDQPGVAARIAHHQVGEFIEVDDLSVDRLHALVQIVRNTPAYRENAQRFKQIITGRRGLDAAAAVIERAFEKALAEQPAELPRR